MLIFDLVHSDVSRYGGLADDDGPIQGECQMKWIVSLAAAFVVAGLIFTQFTIFVIPPIGAIPEGVTLILLRYGRNESGEIVRIGTNFIDSADALCRRRMGYSNLLCRGMALGVVGQGSTILLRLPYIAALDEIADAT